MMGIIKEDGVMKRTRKFPVDYFKPQRVEVHMMVLKLLSNKIL